jgi:HK97 family phage prohead protease
MPPALAHRRKSLPLHGFKALPAEGPGVYEAIVAVFSNTDLHGDKILPGAFADSLAAWEKSGDPIPVIFSHQWDTLEAHLGTVTAAEERPAGDRRLPTDVRKNGGLWVKMALDVLDPRSYAGRVAELLSRRSLREFSFAYDVVDGAWNDEDTVYELKALDLLEVGPTLKGANPLTTLLSRGAKAGATVDADVLIDNVLEDLRLLGADELAERIEGHRAELTAPAGSVPDEPTPGDDGNAEDRPDSPAEEPDEGQGNGPEDGNAEDPGPGSTGEATRALLELDVLELS